MAYVLNKLFQNTKGLDLRSSDLTRVPGAATDIINMMYRQTGAFSKRKGFQINTEEGVGGLGLTKFNNINTTTGAVTEELLTVDDNLHIYTENDITFTYTGSGIAYYDMYLDTTGVFMFDVYEDNVIVSSTNLGTGKGASDTTVTQLVAILHALTDFTCTVSGSPTTPAAFLPLNKNVDVNSGGITINFYTWVQINTPGTYSDPFSSHYAAKDDADFENATFAQLNDVLYISNGYDDFHKYDGTRLYKVGLPKATTPTALTSGANPGSFTAGRVLRYKIEVEYTDAKENLITGEISEYVEITVDGSGNGVNVTYTELAASSGYDTDGTLKYNIYRTDDSADATDASLYYLVHTADHGDTIPWEDTGAAEGAEYITPVRSASTPPKARYVDVWRSQLVLTGIRSDVNTVYYNDIDTPEGFNIANSFICTSRQGGGNTGIKSIDNVLFVFKERSITAVTGDLTTIDGFRIDTLSDEGIGCVSHNSIVESGKRIWFLGQEGVYSLTNADLQLESSPIKPLIKIQNSDLTPYTRKRALGFHWIDRDLYILILPNLLQDGSSVNYTDTTNSNIIVFDLFRGAWLKWNNINMIGGMCEYNNEVFFSGLALDSSSDSQPWYYKFLEKDDDSDYADHESGISFTYSSHWEDLGEPSVFKKFLRIKVHSLDGSIDDFETDAFDLDVVTQHDYEPVNVSSLTLFSGNVNGWGESEWGIFPWGDERLTSDKAKLLSRKARSLRVIFTNSTIGHNILISGYELEIATPYDMQMKE